MGFPSPRHIRKRINRLNWKGNRMKKPEKTKKR